ncbi:OLC1v1033271C1 [Oldenlandia corymbosa var. corymbosa]|uniref:OLC1v1033271C1 n=1 Tax=Oldenlandia corymbosa var. corymbosa TaxID=529605 RepID=A0AAV1CQX2_OLDCO|nr:OLC1v1033271C1 [Oldenlandia corymbosa var. corymbosa]
MAAGQKCLCLSNLVNFQLFEEGIGKNSSDSSSGEEGELPATLTGSKRDEYDHGRRDRKREKYDSDDDGNGRGGDDDRGRRSRYKNDEAEDGDVDEKKYLRRGRDENDRLENGRSVRDDDDRKGRRRSEHHERDRVHKKTESKGRDTYDDVDRKDKRKRESDERNRGSDRGEDSDDRRGRDDNEKGRNRDTNERYKGRDREREDDDDRRGKKQSRRERHERDGYGSIEDKNVGSDSDPDRKNRKSRRDRRDREREKRREDERKDRRRRWDEGEKEINTGRKEEDKNGEREVAGGQVNVEPNVLQKPENLGRIGGVYIPPFKLARMMKEVEDKASLEYQKMTWDALRKSINGLVNKANAINIKNIIPELFAENLIRGRGLFCRSCMKSQMASPGFTDVFAALVAVANTKFPEVGELLLKRIILQLQRAYRRNDKPQLLAAVKFVAHLVNQQVVHELIALELLTIWLENPTDDSVEVAVGFVTECGSMLQDLCPKGLHVSTLSEISIITSSSIDGFSIYIFSMGHISPKSYLVFERFRGILHEGEIDKRVLFLIEGLFALRKAKFQGYPAGRPELDLVELEDQLTHEISLSDEIDPEIALDIFKPDPNFLENEKKYEDLKKSILGDESDDEAESDGESNDDDSEPEEESEEEEERMKIQDETETNLVNLRRTIYLTIMSSVDFEEAGHKLLKIKLEPGLEASDFILMTCRWNCALCSWSVAARRGPSFDTMDFLANQYSMIHRLETNKLRNVAKFFAHLLGTDALPWHVLSYIRLTEEDTTSSSRIFIKILFQELSEHLGIRLLNERLNDPMMQDSYESIFPKDNPKNTRFSINFFTSIGLGGITENLRGLLLHQAQLIVIAKVIEEKMINEESGKEEAEEKKAFVVG